MQKTFKAFLNDGSPSDLPQKLGILNIGDFLESWSKGGEVDTADRTVTTHVHTFADANAVAQYGVILGVRATVGGTTGYCEILEAGTPSSGQCTVTYVAGQPVLTFAAADAVTGARCRWIKVPLTRDGVSWAAKLAENVA